MTTHSPVSPNAFHPEHAHATAPPVAVARAASHALRVAAWTCLLVTPLVLVAVFVAGELLLPDTDDSDFGSIGEALVSVVLLAIAFLPPLAAFVLSLLDFRAVRQVRALAPAVILLAVATWIEVVAALAVEHWDRTDWWWYSPVAPLLLVALVVAVIPWHRRT
jgi:hypothetical protein